MRSACDSERSTTVAHGQSWSLGGCKHERAQSAFALVRALETSSQLVVRGRVELPTFRFSGWQTTTSDPTGSIQRVTLAVRLGGPADSGAHPIMSATGVEGGEKLCE